MKIKLLNLSNQKLELIKVLRTITDLSLADCKLISETPNSIFEVKNGADINLIGKILSKIGIKYQIIENETNLYQKQSESSKINSIIKKYNFTIYYYSDKLTTIRLIREFTELPLYEINSKTENIPATFEIETTLDKITAFQAIAKNNDINLEFTESEVFPISNETNINLNILKIFKFFMIKSGNNKLQVIKLLREFIDASMFECKKLVDFTPSIFFVKTNNETANNFVQKFKDAGATISFEITESVTPDYVIYTYSALKSEIADAPKPKTVIDAKKEEKIFEIPKNKTVNQPKKEEKYVEMPKQKTVIKQKTEEKYVAPKKTVIKSDFDESKKQNLVDNKQININPKVQENNNNVTKNKDLLRNLIRNQDINKGLIYSVIWIEIFSIVNAFLYYNLQIVIVWAFIITAITVSSVFKSKGKIVQSKYRLTGVILVLASIIQTIIFLIVFYNIYRNIEIEITILNIFSDFKIIFGSIVALFLAYLMSCKKTDFSLISNELQNIERNTIKTKKKNLTESYKKEIFKNNSTSSHKDKYSSKKRNLKF